MNYPVIYDPAVAERGHERLTDQMITQVNRHHQEAQKEATILHTVAALQKAQAVQIAQHTRREAALHERNRKLEKKAKRLAGWGQISLDLLLASGSYIAYKAMGAGLIKFNLAFPLALIATLYGGWLLRCLWQEFRQGRSHRHG